MAPAKPSQPFPTLRRLAALFFCRFAATFSLMAPFFTARLAASSLLERE